MPTPSKTPTKKSIHEIVFGILRAKYTLLFDVEHQANARLVFALNQVTRRIDSEGRTQLLGAVLCSLLFVTGGDELTDELAAALDLEDKTPTEDKTSLLLKETSQCQTRTK